MPQLDLDQHSFISINVIRVDARIADDGEVEYAEAPDRQSDRSPEQVCEVCWMPMTVEAINTPCVGPTVPDTIEGL